MTPPAKTKKHLIWLIHLHFFSRKNKFYDRIELPLAKEDTPQDVLFGAKVEVEQASSFFFFFLVGGGGGLYLPL